MNIKDQIIADILEAKKVGLKVQPGGFGSPTTMKCCPMTAVALAKVGPSGITYKFETHSGLYFKESLVMPAAASRLEVDESWIRGFVYGYDAMNAHGKRSDSHKAGFDMGQKIRKLTFES